MASLASRILLIEIACVTSALLLLLALCQGMGFCPRPQKGKTSLEEEQQQEELQQAQNV